MEPAEREGVSKWADVNDGAGHTFQRPCLGQRMRGAEGARGRGRVGAQGGRKVGQSGAGGKGGVSK